MLRNLHLLSLNQFRILLREPAALFWMFLFPVLMAWVLGAAFSNQRQEVYQVGWVSSPSGPLSQWLAGQKNHTPGQGWLLQSLGQEEVSFKLVPLQPEQVEGFIQRGEGLVVDETQGLLRFVYDQRQTEARLAALLLQRAMAGQEGQWYLLQPVDRVGSRYVDFLVPGLIAMSVMNSCIWGIGWMTIELRMKKLLRRMVATPMPRWLWLFTQFLNRTLIVFLEVGALAFFSAWFFGFRLQGSLVALLALLVAGNFAFFGLAVLMGSRTENTTVGNGLVNLITMPMMILSGIFFSYRNFPDWSLPLIRALPLTSLADGVRAVFNEGAGMAQAWPACLLLLAWGLVSFLAGLKIFRWY